MLYGFTSEEKSTLSFVFEIKSTNQMEAGPSQEVVQLTEVDVPWRSQ